MVPLAYFLTWTTYGTWLPGDARGWVHDKDGAWHVDVRGDEPVRVATAQAMMREKPVILTLADRDRVERVIVDSCAVKNWPVHQVSVRTNHVHLVVTAPCQTPEKVMSYLKAWASRGLNKRHGRRAWWTRHGSTRYLNDERSLDAALRYVQTQ